MRATRASYFSRSPFRFRSWRNRPAFSTSWVSRLASSGSIGLVNAGREGMADVRFDQARRADDAVDVHSRLKTETIQHVEQVLRCKIPGRARCVWPTAEAAR